MDDLTRAPGETVAASTLRSSSGTGWGRFAPGTLLAARFRTSRRSAAAAWARFTAPTISHIHGDGRIPLTTDMSRPYAGSAVLLVLAITAVAAYGFYASRGDEQLFGHSLLD